MLPEKYIKIITLVGGRYFITAGIAFVIFYLLLNRVLASKKIQQRYPKTSDYFREIGYSTLTILIFGLVPMIFVQNESISKHTTLYKNINEMGWLYFWSAFPIMIIMHDTYFYWMHRLMHHKKLFKLFHLVHHQSTNPSPWTAYAFHPLEAIIEAGIIPVIAFTLPVNISAFALFLLFQFFYNVYGHLGYELFPARFNKTWIGRWVNTGTAHNQHHQFFHGNYGLYTLIWDRLFGTLERPNRPSFRP